MAILSFLPRFENVVYNNIIKFTYQVLYPWLVNVNEVVIINYLKITV